MKFLFLTCALCALILGVLASAVPNPDALANPEALPNPDALASPDALANPEALPATIEVSGGEIEARQDGSGAVFSTSEGEDPEKREPKPAPYPLYCWKGWNRKYFKGHWVEYCCRSKCCYFKHSIATLHLFSAKATISPKGGVRLWKSNHCTGANRWVSFWGWPILPGPGYQSMSLN